MLSEEDVYKQALNTLDGIRGIAQRMREDPNVGKYLGNMLPEGYRDPDKIEEWVQEQGAK